MTRSLMPWRQRTPSSFGSLSRELEDMMERFFGDGVLSLPEAASFMPSANVAESNDQLEVTVDIPGMKPEDIDIQVDDGRLFVSGKREAEKEEKDKRYHRVERSYGEFRRVIPLACAVDRENVSANYKDGVLTIVLPKTAEVQSKKIIVST